VDEVIAALRKQHEERVAILEQRYDDLMQAFEERPSRPEDLELIKRLQEDEEKKKISTSESIKVSSIRREASYSKVSISQPIFNANNAIHQTAADKSKVKLGNLIKRKFLLLYLESAKDVVTSANNDSVATNWHQSI